MKGPRKRDFPAFGVLLNRQGREKNVNEYYENLEEEKVGGKSGEDGDIYRQDKE